jgi:PncC family amidohydrolase
MIYYENVIEEIKKILVEEKQTLSVAESVTSGHLQAAFSCAKDASKFFQGGITAYNAGQKCRHLNIEPISALDNDCVTGKVACEMAVQVNTLFISDFGISITGYASRQPEKGVNDLFAFLAITQKNNILLCEKITCDKAEGLDAQVDFANQVIKKFYEILKEKKSRSN